MVVLKSPNNNTHSPTMPSLTLWGANMFRSGRCQWMLEELEVEYAHKKVGPLKGIPKNYEEWTANTRHNEELVKLNPRGKVPVLQDGDLVIAESAAINTYLGDKFGDGRIVPPAGTAERAIHDQWCFFLLSEIDAQSLYTAYKACPRPTAIAALVPSLVPSPHSLS